jgi:hypothetical protein
LVTSRHHYCRWTFEEILKEIFFMVWLNSIQGLHQVYFPFAKVSVKLGTEVSNTVVA